MIITIQNQVSSEERNQLETLLEQVIGNHKHSVSTLMDEREVIVLDGSQLDKQTLAAISQQSAVERVVEVKTQYQLVSKAFKAESSRIEIGDPEKSQSVIIGGSNATPVVIAGPCAVESREQLLSYGDCSKSSRSTNFARGSIQTTNITLPVPGTWYRGTPLS